MKVQHIYFILLGFIIISGTAFLFLMRDRTRAMTNEEYYTYVAYTDAKSWGKPQYQLFSVDKIEGIIMDEDIAYMRYHYHYVTSSGDTYDHTGIMKISLQQGIIFSYREVDRPIPDLSSYFLEFDAAMERNPKDISLDNKDIEGFITKVKPNYRILT